MKCFTVKIGDNSYIKNVSRVIVNGWRDKGVLTVSNENDAKHYKTKGQANAWIKTSIKRTEEKLVASNKELKKRKAEKSNYGGWYINHIEDDIKHYKEVLARLVDARTIELDIEMPNFYSRDGIKFDEYQRKWSGMTLHKDTVSKRVCKCCGVKMKNIPYFEFKNSNSFRVCVACLKLRQDQINDAFDSMPEDFRDELTAELVLGSL